MSFDRGDLIWIDFTPAIGHEQAGRRPALVLSPKAYNQATGLLIACAVTSKAKGYPFEIPITIRTKAATTPSVVLADQIRNFAWARRNAEKLGVAPPAVMRDVAAKLKTLLP